MYFNSLFLLLNYNFKKLLPKFNTTHKYVHRNLIRKGLTIKYLIKSNSSKNQECLRLIKSFFFVIKKWKLFKIINVNNTTWVASINKNSNT